MYRRRLIYTAFLCSYLAPLCLIYILPMGLELFLLTGLCFGLLGSWLVFLWEKRMRRGVASLVMAKMGAGSCESVEALKSELQQCRLQHRALEEEIGNKMEEIRLAYLEFEDLRKAHRHLEEEHLHSLKDAESTLRHKESLLSEYQKTILEQRSIIEHKQRTISKLEAKVETLIAELRSLLHHTLPVDSKEVSSQQIDTFLTSSEQIHTPFDCTRLLKKYIERTESLTGAHQAAAREGRGRFLDLSLECNAVDRRRLFDSFKDELGAIVFLYSPSEKKFLFANLAVKTLTGWGCEKFMREFPHLTVAGYPQWTEAVAALPRKKECALNLTLQKKAGNPRSFTCYMGLVSKGPFSKTILGIMC